MIASRGTSGAVAELHYDLDFKNEFAESKKHADKKSMEFV